MDIMVRSIELLELWGLGLVLEFCWDDQDQRSVFHEELR